MDSRLNLIDAPAGSAGHEPDPTAAAGSRPGQTAVFFDLDGTLLRSESQLLFLRWCLRRRVVPFARSMMALGRYVLYVTGLVRDAGRLRQAGFAVLENLRDDVLESEARAFLDQCLPDLFRRQTRELIEAHRAEGHALVLISSACEMLVEPIARFLRLDFVIATQLCTWDGRYTGERYRPEPYGAGKLELCREFCRQKDLRLDCSYAYADHHSDAALLRAVRFPCVTHPTRRLRLLARERDWPELDLEADAPTRWL